MVAGDCAGMADCELGALGGPADLERDNRDVALLGLGERGDETFGIAHRLDEKPDHPCRRQVEREIEILVRGRAQLLAGRGRKIVGETLVVVAERREHRARMGDQGLPAPPCTQAGGGKPQTRSP